MLTKLKNKKGLSRAQSRGFTLVEALVAITILIVGVIGPLEIAARGIGDGIFAANQIAANYLAQEAMELVINKRYELTRRAQYIPVSGNLFATDPSIVQCVQAGRSCAVGAKDGTISLSANFDDSCDECRLVFNSTEGLYIHPVTANPDPTKNVGTQFKRQVYLSQLGGQDQLEVKVVVSWKNKDIDKTLTLVEYLFSKG